MPDSDTGKGAAMRKLLKDAVRSVMKSVSDLLPTGLGAVAVSGGIGLIYPPAGIIAAGLLAMIAGVLLIRGGGDMSE